MKYEELKNKYSTFIFDSFDIEDNTEYYKVTYNFEIVDLEKFNPTLTIYKKDIKNTNINKEFLNALILRIGMVELISYWKAAMPHNVIIKAGYLSGDELSWFKKLYYYGLGEFMYTNNINIDINDLMNITCEHEKTSIKVDYNGVGNLIPIGGGKDSCVSLNLLKDYYDINDCFAINPKEAHLKCIEVSGYNDKYIKVNRTIDKRLIELNNKGFLNGHTPFSSLVSFITLLIAYLSNKKYIVLSNESSANESNVKGTKINHQYSKTYEYECDFNNYVNTYLNVDIHYFSLLRPLTELQIAMLFSRYKEYHQVFKSCNVGSKGTTWNWCTSCPKCLFVYIILSPFLSDEEMINIFGENLYEREDLLNTFIELTGNSTNKPFECVGTYEEVNYAISRKIENTTNLPYLLRYYKDNYELIPKNNILTSYNEENNLPEEFINIVRGAINE